MSETWPRPVAIGVLAFASAITVAGSVRLASLGDVLADWGGFGGAMFGAVRCRGSAR